MCEHAAVVCGQHAAGVADIDIELITEALRDDVDVGPSWRHSTGRTPLTCGVMMFGRLYLGCDRIGDVELDPTGATEGGLLCARSKKTRP